jgi:PAS domain S-box-containing protein
MGENFKQVLSITRRICNNCHNYCAPFFVIVTAGEKTISRVKQMEGLSHILEISQTPTPIASLQSFSRKASLAIALIGCAVLLGWIFDIAALKSLLPGLVSMKANTAICFILSGASLRLWHLRNERAGEHLVERRIASCEAESGRNSLPSPLFLVSSSLAILVILISLLTLIQYGFHADFGIDQLLFKDSAGAVGTTAPGRMAPNTALAFLLLGSALLLLSSPRPNYLPAQSFSLVALLIGFLGFLGYVYGNTYFYKAGSSYTAMAAHTAFTFILLCLGILFARPDRGLMAVIASDNAGGIMARRMSPAVTVIPPVVGYLILACYRSNVCTAEMAISLFCILNVVIFAALIWWNAKSLGIVDGQRWRAEDALKKVNEQLENRVDDRTAQLLKANDELQKEMAERQKNYNLLRAVIESTHDAIFVKDIQGRYVMINAASATMLGKPVEEIIGRYESAFLPPEVAHKVRETDRKIMTDVAVKIIEEDVSIMGNNRTYLSTKSVWRDAQGNIMGLVGIARDISKRLQAEEALRLSEQRYRSLTVATAQMVWTCSAEGEIITPQPSWCAYTGQSFEQMKGRGWGEAIHPDDRQRTARAWNRAVETKSLYEVEHRVRAKDDSYRYFWVRAVPVLAEDSSIREWVGTHTDITDRVHAEEALRQSEARSREQATQLQKTLRELQQTQAQLIQTEKISSLGQLVAGVAHEINNPINFIYGNTSHASQYAQDLLNLLNLYLQHYPSPAPEIQEEIEAIDLDFLAEDLPKLLSSMMLGAERIRDLVVSLRTFSRLDEAQMKQVDIHEGIDSTLLILQHRLKAKPERPGIEVIKEYGNLPQVECYPGQLNQVFMNILANAIDALEEYSRLPLLSENRQHRSTIRIRTEKLNEDWIAIRIADSGSGIPEQVQQRLFDPFFTTKPVGKGTGLGLSISYQIVVEKHRGRLKCISALGEGTEFVIEIPLRQPCQ